MILEAIQPVDGVGFGVTIAQVITGLLGAGVGGIVVAFINKKARTPADELAARDWSYTVVKERYDEAVKDKLALEDTIKFLREDASRRDLQDRSDREHERKLNKVILDLEARVAEKDRVIREQEARFEAIAEKVRAGLTISLEDVYGGRVVVALAEEDTVRVAHLDPQREEVA